MFWSRPYYYQRLTIQVPTCYNWINVNVVIHFHGFHFENKDYRKLHKSLLCCFCFARHQLGNLGVLNSPPPAPADGLRWELKVLRAEYFFTFRPFWRSKKLCTVVSTCISYLRDLEQQCNFVKWKILTTINNSWLFKVLSQSWKVNLVKPFNRYSTLTDIATEIIARHV